MLRAARATRDRCRVMLVTVPEETPVNELIETAVQPRGRGRRGARARGGQRRVPGATRAWTRDPDEAAEPAGVTPARRRGRAARRRGRVPAGAHGSAGHPARPHGGRAAPPPDPPALPRSPHELDRDDLDLLADALLGHSRSCRPAGRRDPDLGRAPDPSPDASPRTSARSSTSPVVVCCGSGGVGKTTTAAVIALRGRPVGAPGGGGHHRPGSPPGRRAGTRRAHQHPGPIERHRRGRLARARCGR